LKVLDRYLVRELVIPILFCTVTLIFLILIADLFDNLDELLRNKTPFLVMLKYYLCLIPMAFSQTIAWSVWLGTIFLLVNLGVHNELIAMKAAGLRIITIVRPLIFLALLIGIITFLVSDRIVPPTYKTANELLEIYIEKKKGSSEEKSLKNVTYYSGGNILYYFRKFSPKARTVEDAIILWIDPVTHHTTQKVFAKEGTFSDGNWLFKGITEYQTDVQGAVLGSPVTIPEKNYIDVRVTPRDLVMSTSESIYLSYHELKYTIDKLKENGISVYSERVDLYDRLAAPWKGLVMMLLATPFLASIHTRKSIARNVLICAGLIFAYHVFGAVSIALGKSGKLLPFLSAWGGNIVFATFAFTRFDRANY
jgi:LPS export ABC transporter permease LptG